MCRTLSIQIATESRFDPYYSKPILESMHLNLDRSKQEGSQKNEGLECFNLFQDASITYTKIHDMIPTSSDS